VLDQGGSDAPPLLFGQHAHTEEFETFKWILACQQDADDLLFTFKRTEIANSCGDVMAAPFAQLCLFESSAREAQEPKIVGMIPDGQVCGGTRNFISSGFVSRMSSLIMTSMVPILTTA